MKRIYLIAGEASGDTHGAALMRCLRVEEPDIEFFGAGGEKMKALAGGHFLDWSKHAVIGIVDVLRNYGYFRSQLHRMVDEVGEVRPEAVIFIDYPGFNLRLAKALRDKYGNIPLIYFISPQVWAWNRGRIPKMAQILDLMLCLFPFEKKLYEDSGLRTEFVGHPMLDNLAAEKRDRAREEDLVAFFPGSRDKELRKNFPVLLQTIPHLRKRNATWRFVASAVNETAASTMEGLREREGLGEEDCRIEIGTAHRLMQQACVGAVASGTATMEAAYFGLPYVIVYRVAPITYVMGRMLIRLQHIGMINVLGGREVVKEFLQDDAQPAAIAEELGRLAEDTEARQALQENLREVIDQLGERGAAGRAARQVLREIEEPAAKRVE